MNSSRTKEPREPMLHAVNVLVRGSWVQDVFGAVAKKNDVNASVSAAACRTVALELTSWILFRAPADKLLVRECGMLPVGIGVFSKGIWIGHPISLECNRDRHPKPEQNLSNPRPLDPCLI